MLITRSILLLVGIGCLCFVSRPSKYHVTEMGRDKEAQDLDAGRPDSSLARMITGLDSQDRSISARLPSRVKRPGVLSPERLSHFETPLPHLPDYQATVNAGRISHPALNAVWKPIAQQDPYDDFRRRRRPRFDEFQNPEDIRFEGYSRRGIPDWESDDRFKYDEFRFVRVKYTSYGRTRWGQKWRIDYPDSDLNFSFRLQQLTSLKVNPNPIFLELTDPKIFNYPFLYLIEPGDIYFSLEEAKAMRHYLNNGGFIMVDDFWGEYEWQDFEDAMRMVFPEKSYEELEIDHPIFHSVYDLKTKPQCPAIGNFEQTGETTDRPWDPTAREVHYRAYYDDNGRMCMIACFNTDLGDGWEREGESEFYFKRFSEKEAYPMGINIVVYAMTH